MTNATKRVGVGGLSLGGVLASACVLCLPTAAQAQYFVPGNLVVVVEGCGVYNGSCAGVPFGTGTGGSYGDNQASPLTLFQFAPSGTASATYVNSLVLPQTAAGVNLPVSAEYGSSSEGTIQLSSTGQFLAVAGYGVGINAFNANPQAYGTAANLLALAQSGSLTGQSYTPVPRVVALVDAFGNVDSSTALYNVFNLNNPRSVFTADGTSAYVSGQGAGSDQTAGVFFTPLGKVNTSPTPITGADTTNNTYSQDTRDVQIYSNTLYVSADTKGGSNAARSYVGTLGAAGTPPTTTVGGPVMLSGFGNAGGTGRVTITTGSNGNGNGLNAGLGINLSPSGFFFANASTLYVADTGNGKQTSANSSIGDGGLQKWINTNADGSGTWNLAYTLASGLKLVANTTGTGTTGLYAVTGEVSGNSVPLYATNATIGDLDQTYLYGITDTVRYTTASQAAGESFQQLAQAPADSNFKGVSFAPSAPASAVSLVTSRVLSRNAGTVNVQLTVTNNSGGTASEVTLTGVKIGSTTATVLPQYLGNLAVGQTATVTVSVPGTVGNSGAASTISVSGTYLQGTFGSTGRITLP